MSIHDIAIHDNVIVLRTGSGQLADVGRAGFYTPILGTPPPAGIGFVHNRYFLGDPDEGLHITLPDATHGYTLSTELDWQNEGFDTLSEFLPLSDFPSRS